MNQTESESSLRKQVFDSIGDFLYHEGFKSCEITQKGIVEIVNKIASYFEEGAALFPEVIITNDFDFFRTIPSKVVFIKECSLAEEEFKQALKLCAPLAVDNWIIFIEVKNNKIKYGLINADILDTTPSLYNQTVGKFGEPIENITIAYIRSIGNKTVELIGFKQRKIVSFTLNQIESNLLHDITMLSKTITSDLTLKKEMLEQVIEKLLLHSIQQSHGNLIGVISDSEEILTALHEKEPDGLYLIEPIDLIQYIDLADEEKTSEYSILLRNISSLVSGMINHDGITVISTMGKIFVYHLFIKRNEAVPVHLTGGARKRAFESMKASGYFNACFYKSQDGGVSYWSKNE